MGECRVGQGKTTCMATFLPNLVRTNLFFCHHGLQHLTLLGKSHYLKYLEVCISYGLVYMENTSNGNKIDRLRVSEVKRVFPSLEWLDLKHLPKLKRWWKDVGKQWYGEIYKLFVVTCSTRVH